jgi:hypothetical protein
MTTIHSDDGVGPTSTPPTPGGMGMSRSHSRDTLRGMVVFDGLEYTLPGMVRPRLSRMLGW